MSGSESKGQEIASGDCLWFLPLWCLVTGQEFQPSPVGRELPGARSLCHTDGSLCQCGKEFQFLLPSFESKISTQLSFPLKGWLLKVSLRPLRNILHRHSRQTSSSSRPSPWQQLNKMFIPMSEVHGNLRVCSDIPRINCTAQHWDMTTVQRLFGNLLSNKKSSFAIFASEFILTLLYHKWDTYMPSFWAFQNTSGSELVLKTQPMYH